eukprot:Seg2098.1 transcript_id=Seg2098.1/GoldUCD/mRNA.D3Y31 product="hypothetical protein" protein_id=Seg2098.1/GoldUCD/D3Y31
MIVKRELRNKQMLGMLSSDERLYMNRKEGGRGLISFRDVYKMTKVRVATYMAKSSNVRNEYCSIKREAEDSLKDLGINIQFDKDKVMLDDKEMMKSWKECWKTIKGRTKAGIESKRKENYSEKQMQSWMFRNQEPECSAWLNYNMDPRKTSSIINLPEQMVETRKWKAIRGIAVRDENCRLCGEYSETVEHVLAGCRVIAGTEYLRRHDNALNVLAVAWCKQQGILDDKILW